MSHSFIIRSFLRKLCFTRESFIFRRSALKLLISASALNAVLFGGTNLAYSGSGGGSVGADITSGPSTPSSPSSPSAPTGPEATLGGSSANDVIEQNDLVDNLSASLANDGLELLHLTTFNLS